MYNMGWGSALMGKEFYILLGKLIPAVWGSIKIPVNVSSFEDTPVLASPSKY